MFLFTVCFQISVHSQSSKSKELSIVRIAYVKNEETTRRKCENRKENAFYVSSNGLIDRIWMFTECGHEIMNENGIDWPRGLNEEVSVSGGFCNDSYEYYSNLINFYFSTIFCSSFSFVGFGLCFSFIIIISSINIKI